MTSPASSGSPSRRRVAGLALLGVGVIAAIIGLASMILNGSGDGGQTAAPPPATASPGTPTPGASATPGAPSTSVAPLPTDGNTVTVPTFGATPTPGVAAPPPAAPAPGDTGTEANGGAGGGGGGTGVSRGSIRVYNNSTVTGLAAKAAEDFRAAGWEVGEISNYPFGRVSTTTVYYRPGTSEQADAEELAQEFGLRVLERFDGIKDATPGVIVIVTNEYPHS